MLLKIAKRSESKGPVATLALTMTLVKTLSCPVVEMLKTFGASYERCHFCLTLPGNEFVGIDEKECTFISLLAEVFADLVHVLISEELYKFILKECNCRLKTPML